MLTWAAGFLLPLERLEGASPLLHSQGSFNPQISKALRTLSTPLGSRV